MLLPVPDQDLGSGENSPRLLSHQEQMSAPALQRSPCLA